MRRMGVWGVATSLALGLAGTVAGAERDTYQSAKEATAKKESAGWSWWPFGSSKKEEPPRPATTKPKKPRVAEPAEVEKTPAAPLASGQKALAQGAALMAQERDKFFRRQEVCNELRKIAELTNDDSLRTQADLLESKAWLIYEQRTATARLGGLGGLGGLNDLLPGEEPGSAGQWADRFVTQEPRGERPVRSVVAGSSGNKKQEN